MRAPSLEQLELALATASQTLGREIDWLAAATTLEERHHAKVRIEKAREKRDELSRTLRLLRAQAVGHPQAGGPTT